jgi:hypothetical protein
VLDERDEQEIETRLRAALLARTEMVSHASLRPGVPPNVHTAGLKSRERRWAFVSSWRQLMVPVSVAAALAGGIFVGAALPDGGHGSASAAASGGSTGPSATPSSPTAAPSTAAATETGQSAGAATTFGGLAFQAADWSLTTVDATSACLAPKGHVAPAAGSTALPCGVDALWIKAGATSATWPLSTVTEKSGWWPKTVTAVTAIPCPSAAAATATASTTVATSALLRSTDKYPLSGTATAKYKEWTVSCTDGSGAVPRLWQIATTPPVVLTAVSVNPVDDAALLAIVASVQPAQ